METPLRADATAQASAYYDGAAPLAPILQTLGIPEHRPVLVLVGWASTSLDDDTHDAVDLLLRKVVAPVCRDEGAVIVSGGTDAGVMSALGRAVGESQPGVILVGVAPDAKLIGMGATVSDEQAARPEPRHRIIRTPGSSWGAEGPFLVRVAEHIAGDRGVAVLAIGGGEGTYREITLAARRRWPVLLTTGHGGASDAVARSMPVPLLGKDTEPSFTDESARPGDFTTASPGLDAANREREGQELAAACKEGCQAAVPLKERASVERALRWRFNGNDILKDAWTRFDTVDHIASGRKDPTTALARAVLILATLTVFCGLAATTLLHFAPSSGPSWFTSGSVVLKGLITALPLAAATLLGLIDRRTRTGSWINLRAAAETIIREIYRFRASASPYGATAADSSLVLAGALTRIDTATSGWSLVAPSPAASGSIIWPPKGLWGRIPPCDSLVGPLTAACYDHARVVDQLNFYEKNARDFNRQATRLAMMIFVVAGATAFVFALSWKWQSLTVGAAAFASLAAALLSWREYRQRDARTEVMLSTCVAVRAARGRWQALQPSERETAVGLSTFAAEVEDAIALEGSDWERGLRQAHQGFLERQRGN